MNDYNEISMPDLNVKRGDVKSVASEMSNCLLVVMSRLCGRGYNKASAAPVRLRVDRAADWGAIVLRGKCAQSNGRRQGSADTSAEPPGCGPSHGQVRANH